jgi:hypothetical protein
MRARGLSAPARRADMGRMQPLRQGVAGVIAFATGLASAAIALFSIGGTIGIAADTTNCSNPERACPTGGGLLALLIGLDVLAIGACLLLARTGAELVRYATGAPRGWSRRTAVRGLVAVVLGFAWILGSLYYLSATGVID